jgi:hypothetical protein
LADVFHSIELEQTLLLRRYLPLSLFSSQTIRPAQGFFFTSALDHQFAACLFQQHKLDRESICGSSL